MDAGTSFDYFVYYRVRGGLDTGSVRARVKLMQAALAHGVDGLEARLLQRADEAATWMEIYRGVRDRQAFETALAEAVADNRLDEIIEPGSARHLECFVESD